MHDSKPSDSPSRVLHPISGGSDAPVAGEGGDPQAGQGQPSPPAPGFVPSDEYKTGMATLTGRLDEISNALANFARQPQAQAPVAAAPVITTAQFIEAVKMDDAATVAAYNDQNARQLLQQGVNPQIGLGLEAVSNLTKEVITASLPFYKKYQKEIDADLGGLPPQARLNPNAYRLVHDSVVGRHATELQQEARDAALRTPPPAEAATPSRNGRTGAASETVPSADDLGGREAANAAESKGGQDALAKKLGYADWSDYMKKTEMASA